MTQDLAVWTVLVGFLGLVWVLAFAVIQDDHDSHGVKQDTDTTDPPESEPHAHKASQMGAAFTA